MIRSWAWGPISYDRAGAVAVLRIGLFQMVMIDRGHRERQRVLGPFETQTGLR